MNTIQDEELERMEIDSTSDEIDVRVTVDPEKGTLQQSIMILDPRKRGTGAEPLRTEIKNYKLTPEQMQMMIARIRTELPEYKHKYAIHEPGHVYW